MIGLSLIGNNKYEYQIELGNFLVSCASGIVSFIWLAWRPMPLCNTRISKRAKSSHEQKQWISRLWITLLIICSLYLTQSIFVIFATTNQLGWINSFSYASEWRLIYFTADFIVTLMVLLFYVKLT